MAKLLINLRNSTKIVSQLNVLQQFHCPRSLSSVSTSKRVSNDKFILRSPHKDVQTVVGATFPEVVWSNLGKWESLPAFECAMTGRRYTHGEIYKYSRGFATALLNSGLKRNDVVGVFLPNMPEYAIVLFGIWEAGLIATTANPSYTVDEIKSQLGNCRAKCVVTIPEFVPTMEQVKNSSTTLTSIVVIGSENLGGTHSFSEMIKTKEEPSRFVQGSQIDATKEIAIIPYSSGTTGPPKGVVLSHSNLSTNLLQQMCPTLTAFRRYDDGNEQERLLAILPVFHIYGLNVVLSTTLFMGGHCVTFTKFDPKTFVKTFKAHRPTIAHLVTPLLNFMVNSREFTKTEFEPLRTLVAGAAPVGNHIVTSLLNKADKYFFYQEGYGMTEMSPVSHMLPPSSKNTKIGSIGQSVSSTSSKFVNPETGDILGPNQPGELCVKGPQVMLGYFENEKATKETIEPDGWLHTGDIGYYDEDGYVYIVDRLKELIKVKGLQVAPSELEDLLRKIPGVADCAVIGIPSSSSGELPRGYIVKNSETLSADDVNQFLKEKVSKHKQLAGGIEFVDAIPKAASGKILRRELKQNYLKSRG